MKQSGERRRRFRAAKEVRAIARERIGAPPPSRPIPDKRRRKTEKHKKDLQRELDEQ